MASKRMDLNKRCCFILSGVSNPLGKTLATEMCRRFKPGSLALLVDVSEERLQEVKKELQYLQNNTQIVCCALADWQQANAALFRKFFAAVLSKYSATDFELAFLLHNEGEGATSKLMEPQTAASWQAYVQQNLNAAVALNQTFLGLEQFATAQKLVVNITSSLLVKPFIYNTLLCSCMKARDMYFRAMAAEEHRSGVSVISYSPGILESHKPQLDVNNNIIDLLDLDVDEQWLKLPRVKPMQSTLKLINILQELSFISGHEVDYYDTFNL